jgi:cytoskeletal protein CcmA (bactofilin family)
MKTASLLAALLAALSLLLVSPVLASAAEIRSGPTALVAPGETIDDDLFAGGGQTVTISGRVTGDAYAVGNTVIVNGSVDGDLIAAAQQVIVDGTIGGNVRAAGASITINGNVGRNITGIAQHLNLTSAGRIGGSVVALGQSIDAFGPVGRGPVLARVDTLSVAPTAHLSSTLDYQAKEEASLPTGAVSGAVQFTPAPQQAPRPEPLLNGLFDLGGLIGLVGTFLLGAVAITLIPRGAARATELGEQQPWQTFGLGLVLLLGLPIAALLIAVTLVGIPVAFSGLALYFVGLLLAWPAVGLVIGTQLSRLARPERPLPVLGTLAVGLVVLHLVTHMPFVGPLVVFCSIVFGLGMLVQALWNWRRARFQQPHGAEMIAAAA